MNKIISKLKTGKIIIGMIHVQALPGTPLHKLSLPEIIEIAVKEAEIYQKSGIDAIMLENMHDIPYLNNQAGPEIVAALTAIAAKIKDKIALPCGIQILAGANKAALAVAKACGLEFVRVENFAYAHVADEGFMESCAGELLRYRKLINAEDTAIFTDVKKKHSSHAITSDISIQEAVKTHEFFLSDGIIITGRSTGEKPSLSDLQQTKAATGLPVIAGSGITAENISSYWNHADGFIIGSYFKHQGFWKNELSPERIKTLLKVVSKLKTNKKDLI
jgi:uncharacterized protein